MSVEKPAAGDSLSPHAVLEMAAAFQRSRVLLTAYELDLFTILGEESRSSTEIAQVLGTDERATDRLMNALCALDLLGKRDGRFSNAPIVSRLLVRGKPEFMAGLMHMVHLWETWSTLTAAVRQGRSVVERPQNMNERAEDWLRAFIAAMHWRARQHASSVVALLDLSNVSRVLDVGGGSGAYAMAFVKAKPGLSAVAFDLPSVIPLTEEYIRRERLSDRVTTLTGDYERDVFGNGFDLVFLSAIIHSNSSSQNRALMLKGAEALAPHGQLVVQDFIVNEDRTGPPFAVLFALNMLVGTEAGDTYTESEVRLWMEGAGLRSVERTDTPFGTSLIVGRRVVES